MLKGGKKQNLSKYTFANVWICERRALFSSCENGMTISPPPGLALLRFQFHANVMSNTSVMVGRILSTNFWFILERVGKWWRCRDDSISFCLQNTKSGSDRSVHTSELKARRQAMRCLRFDGIGHPLFSSYDRSRRWFPPWKADNVFIVSIWFIGYCYQNNIKKCSILTFYKPT